MDALGQAHGKIILMGEHSVVYGYPAIALPFLKPAIKGKVSYFLGDIWLKSNFYTGFLKNAPEDNEHLVYAINATLEYLKQEKKNLKIEITSDLPASRGLGSSAAVAVAIIRALFCYFKQEIKENELIFLAHQAEKIAHGNPSGIDVITTAFNQPVWFCKIKEKKEIRPIKVSLDSYLIVIDTEIQGQTKKAVEIIAKKLRENPQKIKKILDKLGQLAIDAEAEINNSNSRKLGQLMTKAHYYLNDLEVSHPVLNHLVHKALEFGALGAKLTGGGLGGCVICLTESKAKAQEIAEKLKPEGAKCTWIYPMKVT